MIAVLDITNTYVRRARLTPALIVVLPIALAVLSWSPDGLKAWSVFWSLFVWAGGAVLMTHLARDRGKERAPELFRSWGGKPTTSLLRYADSQNTVLATRRHERLQKALPDLHIPNKAEESADPSLAESVYDTCVRWLIEHTRDQKKFTMVFDANCDYGFRRNLWGMKPVGVFLCALSIVLALTAITIQFRAGTLVSPISYGSAGCALGLLAFWVFWCNPSWVRLCADAYAERLLATLDTMDLPKTPAKRVTKTRS
jgi:hypothetical protein